eukprot:COSAG02_NODE_2391_length_8978_cov_14.980403_6_plen_79_part_00
MKQPYLMFFCNAIECRHHNCDRQSNKPHLQCATVHGVAVATIQTDITECTACVQAACSHLCDVSSQRYNKDDSCSRLH